MFPDRPEIDVALQSLRRQLQAEQNAAGFWAGELSPSALSTATALFALHRLDLARQERRHDRSIKRGLDWLARQANQDGGWGDTPRSRSNLSTTTLVWAAFSGVASTAAEHQAAAARGSEWIESSAGSLKPGLLSAAIAGRYGKDRTFSVPILTMAALAGCLGPAPEAWQHVRQLPFELAVLPPGTFGHLRLPVVSYALPALIAIGLARHFFKPTENRLWRTVRNAAQKRSLQVMAAIQPRNGGFLEATPLTSFVTMSLASIGDSNHPVALKGEIFLTESQRSDGSWPIDTNLSTWLTTLSINELSENDDQGLFLSTTGKTLNWLLEQQFSRIHPYTQSPPGGWAWTDLPGGVPDADDTAGALIALAKLSPARHGAVSQAAERGIRWLLDLQNRDGGIPTFCRGWGALPFDRSSPDLTAHALRAWLTWLARVKPNLAKEMEGALARGLEFLFRSQKRDGSWVPLWFGNEAWVNDENPLYGTARVIMALAEIKQHFRSSGTLPFFSEELVDRMISGGAQWLQSAQRLDGSWGAPEGGGGGSTEETALAVKALSQTLLSGEGGLLKPRLAAVARGTRWLLEEFRSGESSPAPIGFYFARLWYWEKLYPLIFSIGALQAAAKVAGR